MPTRLRDTALVPTDLAHVERRRQWPTFDFIEAAIERGEAFQLGRDGYVLVGGKDTLMPRFVLELRIPSVPSLDYSQLFEALGDVSCGMIWFDSSDFTSFDIVWRHNLPVTACAVL